MTAALWKSFLFGLVVAASIGPIALLIFATGARRGLGPGLQAGTGAALADLAYALAAFLLGAVLLPLVAARAGMIRAGSSLVLAAFGTVMLLRAARKEPAADTAAVPAARTLLPTFLLTLVNPMTIVIFAGFVPQLPVSGSPARATLLAAALFTGSLTVNLAIGVCGAVLGTALPSGAWRRRINVLSGAGILAFGIAGLTGP